MQYFGFVEDNSVKPGEIVIEGAKYTGEVNVIHMIGVAVFAERLKVAMCHESTSLVAHVNEETYYKLGFERGGDVGCILPYDPDFDNKEKLNKEIAEAILIGGLPPAQPDSCKGCKYENADDGVLVPCGFCKRSHPDNYCERRTDGL